MDLFSRPSVEGLRQAIRTKRGVDVSCNVCGGEEFSMEHVAPLDGAGPGYGARRLKRADRHPRTRQLGKRARQHRDAQAARGHRAH